MAYEDLDRVLDQVRPTPMQEEAMLSALLMEERTETRMKTGKKLSRFAAVAAAAAGRRARAGRPRGRGALRPAGGAAPDRPVAAECLPQAPVAGGQ